MTPTIAATRQLAVLARLGYPLSDGLRAMSDPLLEKLGDDMATGDTLAEAVRRQPKVFSPFYASMVEAAEAAEHPDRILTSLSKWLERADSVRRRLRAAMLYPWLVANLALLQIAFLAGWVFPRAVGPMLDVALPPIAPLVFVAIIVLNALALVDGQGTARFLAVLPWAGALTRLAEQSLWARAVGSLLAAGVPLPDALDRAASVPQDPETRAAARRLGDACRKGASLSQSLGNERRLDPTLAWAAATGEEREDLSTALLDAADALDRQVDRRAAHHLRMAEPWSLLAVGLLVLIAVLIFWGPFYMALPTI